MMMKLILMCHYITLDIRHLENLVGNSQYSRIIKMAIKIFLEIFSSCSIIVYSIILTLQLHNFCLKFKSIVVA